MDSYLKEVSKAMTPGAASLDKSKIHIVIGNEAADLDSVVSALVLAFLCYKKDSGLSSSQIVLPIVNCKREDLPLRTDVVYWLRKHHIDLSWLIHKEDLVSWWKRVGSSASDQLAVTLVDHHNPTTELAFLEAHVVEIVDHHAVSWGGPWLQRCQESGRYRVEMVGSCTTLVTHRVLEEVKVDEEEWNKVLSVVYGVILLDTFNLNPAYGRFLPLDADILTKLESRLGLDSSGRTAVYREVEDAKFDIKDLSTMDLLRRDVKFIHLPYVSASVCSISGMDYETFFAIPDLVTDIDKFCTLEKTKVCVMLTLGSDPKKPGDEIRRGLLLYHQSDAQTLAKELMEFLIKDANLQLRLIMQSEPSIQFPRLLVFSQGNVKLTRKYILPQINTMLCRWSDQISMELLSADDSHGKLVTPLNSPMEVLVGEESVDRRLPSFNNRAMVELVKEKRQRHQREEDEQDENSKMVETPSLRAGNFTTSSPSSSPLVSPGCFTPDNSRLVSPDEEPGRQHHLPSLNNKATVDLVAKKRQATFLSSVQEEIGPTDMVSIPVPLVANEGDLEVEEEEDEDVRVPFTPRNSLVEEGLYMAKSPNHRMGNYVLPEMDSRHTIDMVAEKRRKSLRNKEEKEEDSVREEVVST